MELQIERVGKQYSGGKWALREFSLKMGPGILGLLGPNGAGKTTLMSIVATITRPTEGSLRWNGAEVAKDPNAIRTMLGYLPQDFGVYPNLNAVEFLEYLAAVKGLDPTTARRRIEELLDLVNLSDVRKRPLGSYSGGMKQRIGIAQALLNDPQLLNVDEPTAGLDPEERVRFRNPTTFLSLVGFYVVRNSVDRDQQTGVGRILAAAPMTRLLYTAAKVASNFAVLSAMVVVLMGAAIVMQLAKGEGAVRIGALITPFLLVALPAMAMVAAMAILFETTPVLRSGAGNVIYFFVWTAILAAPIQTRLPDMAGVGVFMNSMEQTVKAIDPAWKRSFSLSLGGGDFGAAPSRTVLWQGLHWDAQVLLGRILWLGVAVGLTALAAVFFHRFGPAYERGRKRQEARENTLVAETTQLSSAAAPVHLTP